MSLSSKLLSLIVILSIDDTHHHREDTRQMLPETDRDAQFEFMFVGTGTSSAVPILPCITDPEQRCKTCLSSAEEDTRGNTSAVVQAKAGDGAMKTILIDCGKTFYRDSLKHFPKRGLRKIDGLLLTHGHADAMYGLDDLRVRWSRQYRHSKR